MRLAILMAVSLPLLWLCWSLWQAWRRVRLGCRLVKRSMLK